MFSGLPRTPRKNPPTPRHNIDQSALNVLYALRDGGYEGALVGGCVRDLALGQQPKDFDVVTDARPDQLKKLFGRRCSLIGKRFRLAHIYDRGRNYVEVATYRRSVHEDEVVKGRYAENNIFGDMKEDAFRRDFTINALYYNVTDFSIIDYVGGWRDMKRKRLICVGDPAKRFPEDPLRMIRAARFCGSLGLKPGRRELKAIKQFSPLISRVNSNRLLEEIYKIVKCGHSADIFHRLDRFGLLTNWLPELAGPDTVAATARRLEEVDRRVRHGDRLATAVSIAALVYDHLKPFILSDDTTEREGFDQVFIDLMTKLRMARKEREKIRQLLLRQRVLQEPPQKKGREKKRRFSIKKFILNEHFRHSLVLFEMISMAENRNLDAVRYWYEKQQSIRNP